MLIWYGIILFIIGLVLATFIPSKPVVKIGSGLMIFGIVLAVVFPLLGSLWENSRTFQIIVYSVVLVAILMMILFSGNEVKKGKK